MKHAAAPSGTMDDTSRAGSHDAGEGIAISSDEPPSTDEPPSSRGSDLPAYAGSLAGRAVVVAYNVDFDLSAAAGEGLEAAAEVADVAAAVADALRRAGAQVSMVPVADPVEAIPVLESFAPDVVFNLVESLGGDSAQEAVWAALLEQRGLATTGCPSAALRLAFSKEQARERLVSVHLPVPRGFCAASPDDAQAALEAVGLPAFVKPARADASLGISQASLVTSLDGLRERLGVLCETVVGPYLVEEWLPGREFNVAILPDGRAAVTEIDYSGCPSNLAPMLTYAAKWIEDSPEYYMRSVALNAEAEPALYELLGAIGRAAFHAIGGSGYGRVDLRCGVDGQPRIIDVNPNPDLHPEAGYSIAARSRGLAHDRVVVEITREALERHGRIDSPHPARRSSGVAGHPGAYGELPPR